jgi:hypothetical protein
LELEVDNTRALETSGTLLLETGNVEAAKQVSFGVFGKNINNDKGLQEDTSIYNL